MHPCNADSLETRLIKPFPWQTVPEATRKINQPTKRVKGRYLFTATLQTAEPELWEDNCERSYSYRNTRNFSGKPATLLPTGRDMKSGKVQVERQGVSLLEGRCTHDHPTLPVIPLVLFMLSTQLRAWWSKHIGPLALKSIWFWFCLRRHSAEPAVASWPSDTERGGGD